MKKERGSKNFENHSPWLAQLKRARPLDILDKSLETNVLIVGGGIAGVTTAFFVLKYTKNNVILLEANKIAHGATGHNAGQIASYFEKPFSEISKEYGVNMAWKAQKDILSAWDLISEIANDAKIKTPITEFTGYAGCTDLEQLEQHLENKYLRKKGGIDVEIVFVSKNFDVGKISKKYKGLYEVISKKEVLELLETKDETYIAALGSRKGLTNSAVFSEELCGFLLFKYKNRFKIFEHSPIARVKLSKDKVESYCSNFKILSEKVVLCTNGFENIKIENLSGKNIDTRFHANVHGLVGYMTGHIENSKKEPTAISYFPTKKDTRGFEDDDSYFYLTRRKFNLGKKQDNLVCIGGPEKRLERTQTYLRDNPHSDKAVNEINSFLKNSYIDTSKLKLNFKWHGLMGYTKNKVRIIGPEPRNKNLLYNLGCNGVGILPSIFGARKISKFLQNKIKEKSIFDPFYGVK